MTLTRTTEHHDVHPLLFHQALRLGQQYGWQPSGTRPPHDWADHCWEAWDETEYACCLGEIITADDALRWAMALVEALDDLPDEELLPSRVDWIRQQPGRNEDPIEARIRQWRDLPLAEFFSGRAKLWLEKFIKFLREGDFAVNG